jgi:hypothetical protein
MRRKESERLEAILLRQADWPLRRIALELGVSLSSVSTWVRDVPVPSRPAKRKRVKAEEAELPLETGTQRCGRCHQELPFAAFSRHPKRGRQWWCKDCFRAYFKARGDVHRKQSAAARDRRWRAARRFVEDYLSAHPCLDCGEADISVLEFDHVRPKTSDVSVLIAEGWSISRIQDEIKDCEVVCVNCHRRRTARRAHSWRTDPSIIETSIGLTPGERRNMLHVHNVLSRTPCADCGCTDLLVLEFDHVGRKRGNVIDLARNGCALQTLKDEIAECQVRCATCHRRRTRALQCTPPPPA